MSISVCMLTYNDGEHITKCLESVKSIADEFIIVDTGSQDNTLKAISDFELKYNIPCKVVHHVWDHNFSKGKNIAITNAIHNWILMLDPQDFITKQDTRKIKSLTLSEEYLGYYLYKAIDKEHPNKDMLLHLAPASMKAKDKFLVPELNLFRNHDLIKYKGVIYESIDESLHKIGQSYKTNIRIS